MSTRRTLATLFMMCLCLAPALPPARGDDLRNLKRGEPMPAYKLVTIDGAALDSETLKGSVVVMVYLTAEQRSSELAAMDSRAVTAQFASDPVKLIHVTADIVHKAYFQRFRQERALEAPLALDADRALYGKLGLIVFPTTIIVNKEGKLAHVISIHSPDYSHMLDSFIRHALGTITDDQLQERLKARASTEGSPKSLASSHRSVARLMREKGRLDAARDELNKAREQDPKNPEILLDLADLDMFMGKLDEAESLTQSVLDAQADHRRAKQLKGILLYRRGNFSEAESILLDALNLNPDPARAHYYLGRIYEQQSQPAKALEHYRLALQRFLDEPEGEKPK